MVAAIVCGILAVSYGEKTLGWIGIGLSIGALVIQIVMMMAGAASLAALLAGEAQ